MTIKNKITNTLCALVLAMTTATGTGAVDLVGKGKYRSDTGNTIAYTTDTKGFELVMGEQKCEGQIVKRTKLIHKNNEHSEGHSTRVVQTYRIGNKEIVDYVMLDTNGDGQIDRARLDFFNENINFLEIKDSLCKSGLPVCGEEVYPNSIHQENFDTLVDFLQYNQAKNSYYAGML